MQCRSLYLAGLAVLVAAVGYYLWKSRTVLYPSRTVLHLSRCLGVTCAPSLVCNPITGKCVTPPPASISVKP